jgi:hypothetical protein
MGGGIGISPRVFCEGGSKSDRHNDALPPHG